MFAVGVDVQVSRGCPYAVLDEGGVVVGQGWVEAPAALVRVVEAVARRGDVVVGIDAPRMPLPAPRRYALERGVWMPATRDNGRHAEIAIKALGLANPQWTPLQGHAPPWMTLGFSFFDALAGLPRVVVHEVFPSASYRMLEDAPDGPRVTLSFSDFRPGPKDMLDAVVAAVTAGAWAAGQGSEVGGGDGLGTIVLPRPLSTSQAAHPALAWPVAPR